MPTKRLIRIKRDLDLAQGDLKLEIDEIDTRNAEPSDLDRRLSQVKTLGDLAFSQKTDVSSANPYSCTFTYNPFSKFSITDTYDQYVAYDEVIVLKDPRKIVRTRNFGYFSFVDQYRIFVKHFKRWVKGMNKILDKKDQLLGWDVYIEKTKIGTLHAHAVLWSNCNYDQAFGNYSATVWAGIAKGQVRAMNGAFTKVNKIEAWRDYMVKDTSLEIF